jgi:CubicO group peptidase (beta-lactamase class C family)
MQTKNILNRLLTVLVAFSLISCKPDYKKEFADKFNKVDSIFNKYDSLSPGCAIGIVYKGDLIYAKGYGMADIENRIRNKPDKLFDIASTSKQFNAISLLLLQEQGKLSLEDRIKKYIPELPSCYDSVLVKHLPTHTSGIRDFYALMDLQGIKELSTEEQNWANDNYNEENVFGILLKQKGLNFKPGSYYNYSGSGYYLAGKIIERVSGMSLRDFYEENIFIPLGMKNTFLYDDSTFYNKNRTMGYSKSGEGFRRNLIKYQAYGDGQIMSNIYDLYLWDKNFYDNKLGKGDKELIKTAYKRYALDDGQTVDYSYGGLEVSKYKGLVVVDRMGGTQGICSDIVRFPDQAFTVICLSNYQDLSPDPWEASLKIANIFIRNEFKEETDNSLLKDSAQQAKIDLNEIAGFYFNEITKDYFVISAIDEKLKWNHKNLIQLDSNNFNIEGWSSTFLEFIKESSGDNEMHMKSFTFPVEVYTKKSKVEYNAYELSLFAGNYFCSELDLSCSIVFHNNKLVLIDSDKNESNLKYLFKDTFEASYNGQKAVLQFVGDKKNELLLNTDYWIKNLRFEKITR